MKTVGYIYEAFYIVNDGDEVGEQRWLFTKLEDAVEYVNEIVTKSKSGSTLLRDLLNEYETMSTEERKNNYYYTSSSDRIYIHCFNDGRCVEIGITPKTVYNLK